MLHQTHGRGPSGVILSASFLAFSEKNRQPPNPESSLCVLPSNFHAQWSLPFQTRHNTPTEDYQMRSLRYHKDQRLPIPSSQNSLPGISLHEAISASNTLR